MKKRIVCFGDSNTWGYIPITGERYDESIRWPARLQEKLGYQTTPWSRKVSPDAPLSLTIPLIRS